MCMPSKEKPFQIYNILSTDPLEFCKIICRSIIIRLRAALKYVSLENMRTHKTIITYKLHRTKM